MNTESDVLIIGAGIVGLAQAWAAARAGKSVRVLERNPEQSGASVRNFGMIIPAGQPPGDQLEIALRSRELWQELIQKTGIYGRECGLLFLAIDPLEARLMEEFAERSSGFGYHTRYVDGVTAREMSRVKTREKIRGGLLSETEINIDPRQAMPVLAHFLKEEHSVDIQWESPVVAIENSHAVTNDGRRFRAEQILICQGRDASYLFPESFENADLIACKLHMLRSSPLGFDMGPMLATGLTLRHYPSFEICDSLAEYKNMLAEESRELDRFGIHILASQDCAGRLVLGDSHQYGEEAGPFNHEVIDDLILAELQKRIELPSPAVDQRWQGFYLKRKGHTLLVEDARPGVRLVNGIGGNGMTMSFGIAERMWQNWDDPALLTGLKNPESKMVAA